ncbi:MAG: glycosyl hydrolase [Ferruginibacter sp.]
MLKIFHVDSWECGSQNWSPVFASEFKKRRGYDMMPYLLTMTGVPVGDAATSEKFLHDVRQTIAELISDVFYVTLNNLAHKKVAALLQNLLHQQW